MMVQHQNVVLVQCILSGPD